ncbi:DUF262 domain-containing protein [Roseovarius sp. A46]|uniref:DUF262 domain-containing protein n=1 Tax=Roseovarius sp. A46 TaxID=2109331 RepID=UPI00101048A3|nr:DUF262 domain-containing protein [Roseovarius sp. A46]RXV62168.1 DUF262 domain-containing protein [Roseovarius sp. A46]
MKIESNDRNVEDLLNSAFFIVPRFQRPYSWDDENIEEFWNDTSSADDDYFIGSMVVYSSGRQQFGVVDGQQRLTTITILLCSVRDKLAVLGEENLAKGLHQLIERVDRDNNEAFVLQTESSYPFFQDAIQSYGKPTIGRAPQNEEERLEAAYKIFNRKIDAELEKIDEEFIEDDDKCYKTKIGFLKNLRDKVLFLKLIFVELDNEDDAYLIFETLNTRGKDLALSDLLKNHFSKMIRRSSSVDFVRERWAEIFEEFQNSSADIDLDTFFTQSWASRFEATTQQKAFKLMKGSIGKGNARDHLNFFRDDATLYRSIFEPDYGWRKDEKEIARSLRAHNLFRIRQQTPATLSLVRAYRKGVIKNSRLRDTIRAIENFHFAFTAVTSSRSSGGISAMYSSFGRRLYEANTASEAGIIIAEFIEKLRERRPSESEFVVGFKEIYYTKSASKLRPLVHYILSRIARYNSLAFTEDYDDLTIEHIYPQSHVSSTWPEEIVGQLGNLVLLSQGQNAEVGVEDFERKQQCFNKWSTTIPSDVLTAEEWTPEVVNQRSERMALQAYREIWAI